MARQDIVPTGVERFLGEDELIVSKTDTKGRITYVNETFLKISGYSEEDMLGQPHSVIRHPDMPRCVFKLLWDTIQAGQEIFAYVINSAKNGDHYWVFAHVTPSFAPDGRIIGFHSNRRAPERAAVDMMTNVYKLLREEEARHSDPRKGMQASFDILTKYIGDKNMQYDEFIFTV